MIILSEDISEDKHELLLRLPKYIHNVLVRYKKMSGVNVTNYIYKAIMKEMISDGLITLTWLRENGKKKMPEPTIIQPLPEELKFCDGDSCGVTTYNNQKS